MTGPHPTTADPQLPEGARSETVVLDGGRVRVFRLGAGPPVLFLHPGAGALPWNAFHARLGESFELVLPEHPGFGGSDDRPDLTGMPALAAHYRRLRERLGLRVIPLVGASLGGWLAAEIAADDPASVPKLVLLGAPGLAVAEAPYPDIFEWDPDQTRAALFHRTPPPPPSADALRHRASTARYTSRPLLHNPTLAGRLGAITARTTVVRAEFDRIVGPAVAQAYADGVAGSELVTVPDCGHAMYYERPDAFADVVLTRLTGG